MTRARDLAAGTFELATGGVLKLETSDTTVTDGSVLGKIEFKAPDEASGTDAILVGAAIEAVAEGTFAADNNATELVFKTGASAAADAKMILDSSGNLLVGTTDTDPANSNVNGLAIGAANYFSMTRTGGASMILNRKTSDGDIALFRKDGSTMGSIGVQSTDQLYIGTPDGNGVGIVFDGDNRKIDPTNGSGSNLDAAVDLGNGSHRFKDLYLSGGVYLGGTGAANKLTDFETGTFTPSLTFGGASVGITYSSSRRYGIYTKIGNVVTYFIHLELTSKGSSTGGANITGLPFTATSANGNQNYVPGAVFISNMASLSTVPVVRSLSGTTSMDIYQMINSQYSGITNANYTNTTGFQVSGHYYVA